MGMMEIRSTVSNGKRSSVAVNPSHQAGDDVMVKFEGMERDATITGGCATCDPGYQSPTPNSLYYGHR